LPALLTFYKTHYLDTTSLIRPAEKEELKVIAKFDFDGRVSLQYFIPSHISAPIYLLLQL
jgi:hypothetical protein